MTSTAHRSDVTLQVNGVHHRLDLDHRTTLLDALRERLDLTGSKKGCDHVHCGACTALVDGRRSNACLLLAVAVQDRETGDRGSLGRRGDHEVNPAGVKGIGELGIAGPRRRSPTPSGTRPASANDTFPSAPTASSPAASSPDWRLDWVAHRRCCGRLSG